MSTDCRSKYSNKPIYMLSLGTLTYVIQVYMLYSILFTDFEKLKLYIEF